MVIKCFFLFFSLRLQAILNFPKYCEPVVKGEGNYSFTIIVFLLKKISVRSKLLKFFPFWSSKWTWYTETLEKYWTSFEESHADCLSQGNIKVIFYVVCLLFLYLLFVIFTKVYMFSFTFFTWRKNWFQSFLIILRRTNNFQPAHCTRHISNSC